MDLNKVRMMDELRDETLKTIEEWKTFWMNQTQNSEADRQNYFSRAFGVDSNMKHHLARKVSELTQKRERELLARIEELEKQASLKNEINRNLANHNSDLTDRISSMGKLLRSFIVRGYPTTKDWLQFEDQILKALKQNEGG